MEENKLYAEIDRLRVENAELKAQMKKDFEEAVAVIHDEGVRRIMAEDERDGYRNGQAQLQKICNDLQDVITEYADERKKLIAELSRLKAPSVLVALIEKWAENVEKGICP